MPAPMPGHVSELRRSVPNVPEAMREDALRAVVASWRAEARQLIEFATARLKRHHVDRPVDPDDPDAVARLDALSRASALNAAARDVEHVIGPGTLQ